MFVVWVGAGGGGGGGMNVLRAAAAHITGIYSVSPLRTACCARMWSKTRCHKHPCLWRPCRKHWYLQRFCLFIQHTVLVCGTRRVVSSVHAFGDHAASTGINSAFASLYNILCKDVQQDALSQASMPLATMPQALVSTMDILTAIVM